MRDDYTFDFLELGERHAERELERAMVGRIEDFLRAMGGLFAFVGSQCRLEVDDKEYFVEARRSHGESKVSGTFSGVVSLRGGLGHRTGSWRDGSGFPWLGLCGVGFTAQTLADWP